MGQTSPRGAFTVWGVSSRLLFPQIALSLLFSCIPLSGLLDLLKEEAVISLFQEVHTLPKEETLFLFSGFVFRQPGL